MNWTQVLDGLLNAEHLSSAEKLTLICLAHYSSKGFFPSTKVIAKKMGVHCVTVYRALKKLEEKNLIRVLRRNGAKNEYNLLLENLLPQSRKSEPEDGKFELEGNQREQEGQNIGCPFASGQFKGSFSVVISLVPESNPGGK